MRFQAKWFLMILALLTVFTFGGMGQGVRAQNVPDNVSVMAGAVNSEGQNTFNGTIEIQKTLGTPKLILDNTTILSDGSQTVVSDTALLRGYLGTKFFVAGGATFGRAINVPDRRFEGDTFLNPTFQVGVTLDATKRLQFEPYAQLDTTDLLSDNDARSLSGGLVVNYAVNDKFGFTGDVGLTQTRANNRFFDTGGINSRYGTAGLYFNF